MSLDKARAVFADYARQRPAARLSIRQLTSPWATNEAAIFLCISPDTIVHQCIWEACWGVTMGDYRNQLNKAAAGLRNGAAKRQVQKLLNEPSQVDARSRRMVSRASGTRN